MPPRCSAFHKTFEMDIRKRIVATAAAALLMVPATGAVKGAAKPNGGFNWGPVMEAIIHVESGGRANAVSGASVGAMQITPICVRECNNILKRRGSEKRYKLADRLSVEKSKEMFLLLQSHFNPGNNVEKAIRAWNGGNNYSVKGTQRYYEKVVRRMKGNS